MYQALALFFVFFRIGLSQKCNKYILASDIKAKQKKHKKAQKNWYSSSHARKDKPSGRGSVSMLSILSILNMKKQKRTVKKMIKEKFLNLVNACKNDRDMLDIIESDMRALGEYVYAVHIMETSLPIIRVNYEGQELRDRVEKLDHNRRTHHERAIMGVKRMNRFAEMEGIEKIFTGDVNNRYAIADFCRDTTVEMFDDRTGRSLSLVHPEQIVDDEPERN